MIEIISHKAPPLLSATDPAPVITARTDASSPYVLTCDHAGNLFPKSLGRLGLSDEDCIRHIAWDPGAREIAEGLSERLNAPLIIQNYSRLVCDCNRRPDADDLAPVNSDGTVVLGNQSLGIAERKDRIDAIHAPFHSAIENVLDARNIDAQPTLLVAIHSYTPHMNRQHRPWHVGILYPEARSPFARALIKALKNESALIVGDNEPYSLITDYSETMMRHGVGRGVPALEIEIRQDMLLTERDHANWVALLARVLSEDVDASGYSTVPRENLKNKTAIS